MKKFILIFTFILMFFTSSIVSSYAKASLDDVKNIYIDIIKNYKYNRELGKLAYNSCPGKNIAGIFYHDIIFAQNYKGGACRQLANVFISRLLEKKIYATQIVFGDKNSDKNSDESLSHSAVIYTINDKKYVADPALHLQLMSEGLLTKKCFVNMTLSEYINCLKKILGCPYTDFVVLNAPPIMINKDVTELKNTIDYQTYDILI